MQEVGDLSRFDYDDGDEYSFICDNCRGGSNDVTLDKKRRQWICDDCVVNNITDMEVD